MTADDERVIRRVASELYELAHIGRHDVDGVFVRARRTFLTELASQLMATVAVARDPEKGGRR